MDRLDDKIGMPKDMSSTELLNTRMTMNNGHASLQIEEGLQMLLKAYGLGYAFEVHYNNPGPFNI